MTTITKDALLAEEELIVRHAGEIPEIVFHSALHYLTRDQEGPALALDAADIRRLEEQVIARYREILLRDLDPANRDLRIYRGIRRCIFNWERLDKFLARQGRPDPPGLREEVAHRLGAFLHNEELERREGVRSAAINCTAAELEAFCRQLDVTQELPLAWQEFCSASEEIYGAGASCDKPAK